MGYEESQADTNEVIKELELHNSDGTPNWKQLGKLGEYAQRTHISGDGNYEGLQKFMAREENSPV